MPPAPDTGDCGRLRSQSGSPARRCSPGGRSEAAQRTVGARCWLSGLLLCWPAGDCGRAIGPGLPPGCAQPTAAVVGVVASRGLSADAGWAGAGCFSGLKLGRAAVAREARGLSNGTSSATGASAGRPRPCCCCCAFGCCCRSTSTLGCGVCWSVGDGTSFIAAALIAASVAATGAAAGCTNGAAAGAALGGEAVAVAVECSCSSCPSRSQ